MKTQKINSHRTGKTLFEGPFATLQQALEQAIEDNICLDYADLSGAVLINATLDGAQLRHACFHNTNLMGTNLSEAFLEGANFANADLQNACLCFSNLQGCNFDGAEFGGTDIAGSNVSNCLFSTQAAFLLNFTEAASMEGTRYCVSNTESCSMSLPPVLLQGLAYPVILLDQHIKIGPVLQPFSNFLAYTNDNMPAEKLQDNNLHVFVSKHKNILRPLIDTLRPAANLDISFKLVV